MTRTLFQNKEGQRLEIYVNTDNELCIAIHSHDREFEDFYVLDKDDEKLFFEEVNICKKDLNA